MLYTFLISVTSIRAGDELSPVMGYCAAVQQLQIMKAGLY